MFNSADVGIPSLAPFFNNLAAATEVPSFMQISSEYSADNPDMNPPIYASPVNNHKIKLVAHISYRII